jgi:hypothetical protein
MMIEKNKIYRLISPLKGWPVQEADDLKEASRMILGSPYWNIPQDIYIVIDKNETYSLLAVYRKGKPSFEKRYMAVNMKLINKVQPISEDELRKI